MTLVNAGVIFNDSIARLAKIEAEAVIMPKQDDELTMVYLEEA